MKTIRIWTPDGEVELPIQEDPASDKPKALLTMPTGRTRDFLIVEFKARLRRNPSPEERAKLERALTKLGAEIPKPNLPASCHQG